MGEESAAPNLANHTMVYIPSRLRKVDQDGLLAQVWTMGEHAPKSAQPLCPAAHRQSSSPQAPRTDCTVADPHKHSLAKAVIMRAVRKLQGRCNLTCGHSATPHPLSKKLSITRFSPALSNATVSLFPSTARTSPYPNLT